MGSSQKIMLNYLVFDDENEELQQNKMNVSIEGMECNVIFINPINHYDVEKDEFKIDEFKDKILLETKGKYINLIASDWNMIDKTLNYPEVNALEIIEILIGLNEKYKKAQYLIYSGKPSEVSNVVVTKIKNEIDSKKDDLVNSEQLLSLLLEVKLKFCSRANRFREITTLISSNKTINLIVLNSLANFDRNKVINMGNKSFDGRHIGTLIDYISQNNDLGLKFIREFLDLAIANYTELNE